MIDRNRIQQTFCRLTSIDSPSFHERAMADCLTNLLKELGLSVEEDRAGDKIGGTTGNLYAVLPGTVKAPPLLFAGHMDTVEPALHKKAQVHTDGTVTSDGTTVLGADDAAGIAAILEALMSIRENGVPHRTLEILFTVAEEPYDRGSEVFDFEKIHAREGYVLDLDGPVGRAVYSAPSICGFSAVFHGKSAHAGFAPEDGCNAVAAAALAISRLKMGHLDADTTLNIGTIRGGTAVNIVPDRCEVEGEIRSYVHENAKRTLEDVSTAFQRAAAALGAGCEIAHRFGCYAFDIDPRHAVIRRYENACKKVGAFPRLNRSFGGSDANQLNRHGITALVIANAMFQPHTCREYTTVDDLVKVAQITCELMACAE